MQPYPDAEILHRWCRAGLDGLAEAREEIDALNVYPVPDGDTGTNLFLTMEAAASAARECAPEADLASVAGAMARGAMLGARGNSGIILAQMLRGVAAVFARPGVSLGDGRALAEALRVAADAAYDAVHEPVEGTILTVARAAADVAAARIAADTAGGEAELPGLPGVALAAARAARQALAATPDQLDVLATAGVVDAGGRGLTVLLDAFDTVLTGRRPLPAPRRVGEHHVPVPITPRVPGPVSTDTPCREGGGTAADTYEVMYTLQAPDTEIPALRERLADLGDSLVVVGGDGTWSVHVHVADAGAAIEAGLRVGRASRISVTHLPVAEGGPAPERSRLVVAFAAGPGLAALFESAGALVADTPAGHRPSTGEILAAVGDIRDGEVVILPNERDAVPVAEAAAAELRGRGCRVAVVPTIAQVQGLAAVAVHEPGRAFDADVVAMTAAAGHARHGAVTVATREAVTMAGICRPGDVLGVVEGDFAVIGDDVLAVAQDVAQRMLSAGGELVTLVLGDGADAALAEGVEETVRRHHPEVDTVVYDGGQARYPLLLGVE